MQFNDLNSRKTPGICIIIQTVHKLHRLETVLPFVSIRKNRLPLIRMAMDLRNLRTRHYVHNYNAYGPISINCKQTEENSI